MLAEHLISTLDDKNSEFLSQAFNKDILNSSSSNICRLCKDENSKDFESHLVFDFKTGRFSCPLLDPYPNNKNIDSEPLQKRPRLDTQIDESQPKDNESC